jgi:putative spermidine/putrescine transport system permease protein
MMAARKEPSRLLVWPPLLFLAATFGLALIIFLRNSFYVSAGMGISGPELTLANYAKLLDPYYAEVLLHTVLLSLGVVVLSALLGYPLALFISRSTGRWGAIFLLTVLASNAMSLVVRSLGWIGILNDNGPINAILRIAGAIERPLRLLGNDGSVLIGLLHGFLPWFVLTLLPVLQAIDPALEDAAAGMGAGRWTIVWRITLPLSFAGVVGASLLTFAMCMGAYTMPALLAGGRATTFPVLIQQQISTVMNYPLGAALAFVLLLLVLVMTWLGVWFTRRLVYVT